MAGRPKRSRRSRLRPLAPHQLSSGPVSPTERRWSVPNRVRSVYIDDEIPRTGLADALRSAGQTHSSLIVPELQPDDTTQVGERSDDEITDTLYRHLRGGRGGKANGVVQLLLLAGRSVPQIIDGSYQRALAKLGEDWNGYDTGDACWEHRALEICIRILRQLPMGAGDGKPFRTAVGAAPANDPYILPVMAASTVLEAQGFDVTNLGSETPTRTLVQTIRSQCPSLVFLCLTGIPNGDRTRDIVAEVLEAATSVDAKMIVGGQQADQIRRHDHPELAFGNSMMELGAFASQLGQLGQLGEDDG